MLRFLKRGAVNLPQAFRIVVPSKRLPLGDRRRIVAKQLGDFVHLYNKVGTKFLSTFALDPLLLNCSSFDCYRVKGQDWP